MLTSTFRVMKTFFRGNKNIMKWLSGLLHVLISQGSKRRRFRQLVLEPDQIVNNVQRVQISQDVLFSIAFLCSLSRVLNFRFVSPM